MALTERPLGVADHATKIILFVLNLFSDVTAGTHPFTALNTARDLRHSPAGPKLCRFDRFVTILWDQVILGYTVVVTT